MSVAGTITQLAGKRMTGVEHYYAPDDLPPRLSPDRLPALILLYDDSFYDSFRSASVDQETYWYRLLLRHLLLIDYQRAGIPGQRFVSYAALLDAYRDMLDDDVYLNGNLSRAVSVVQTQVGLHEWEGDLFVGIDFRLECYVA